MANSSFNFTKEAIAKIVLPKDGRDIYKDTKEQGLILIVSYTGKKAFYIAKNIKIERDKKYYRKKVGDFPDLSISDARAKVSDLKVQIAKGFNPFEEATETLKEITFKELFDKYINDYAKHSTKGWKADIADINKKAQTLYDKGISSITKEEIQNIFNKLTTTSGKYAANRFLDRLKAIFNKGIEWDLLEKNPTNGIKQNKKKTRDRYITAEEVDAFLKAVEEEKNPIMRDFLLISLYTGIREGNVKSMRWKDISFESKTWYLGDTKNGESQYVALSDKAVTTLKKIAKTTTSQWVLPSDRSASGHIEEPRKAMLRALKKANMEDFRIHDLRRTRGSWMAMAGASQYIIGKALNHKSPSSTAIYARLSLDPVREFMEKADSLFIKS